MTDDPSAWRALRTGLVASWDHAALVVGLNLSWAAVAAAILSAAVGASQWCVARGLDGVALIVQSGAGWVAAGLAAGPGFAMAQASRHEFVSFPDLFEGVSRHGYRYGTLALLTTVVEGECLFYGGWLLHTPMLSAFTAIPVYLGFAWMTLVPYQFGLVSLEDRTVFDAIRRSVLLALDNPWYTLLTGTGIAAVAILLGISGIGFALAALPVALGLTAAVTAEVMRQYHPEGPDYGTDRHGGGQIDQTDSLPE